MESSGDESFDNNTTDPQSIFAESLLTTERFLNGAMDITTTLMENFKQQGELYKVCQPTDPHFKSLWEAAGLSASKVFFGDFVKCVTAHTLENFDESTQSAIRNAGGWFAYLLKFLGGSRTDHA